MTINRRNFVKSLGSASVLLPFYDLLAGKQAYADCGKAHRMIFLYHPDGVVPTQWNATGSGTNFALNFSMTPLEEYKSKLSLFRGLEMRGGEGNSHPKGALRSLTGAQQGGRSLDNYLANTTGANSLYKHLHLGVQATKNADDTSSVTYYGANQPKLAQDNPVTAWNDIFQSLTGEDTNASAERSILDHAMAEISDLRGKLQAAEKSKLDLHLEALRSVEQRIGYELGQCTVHQPQEMLEHYHTDRIVPDVFRTQIDTMVQAMSCDLTRVGTLQLSHHTSNMKMDFDDMLGMPDNYSHGGSHNNETTHSTFKRWVCKEVKYLLDQLSARPDPVCGGTLLDNTLVYVFTDVRAGAQHGHHDMPLMLIGDAGVRSGRIHEHWDRAHSDMLVTLSKAMGNNISNFGNDSSGGLGGVLA